MSDLLARPPSLAPRRSGREAEIHIDSDFSKRRSQVIGRALNYYNEVKRAAFRGELTHEPTDQRCVTATVRLMESGEEKEPAVCRDDVTKPKQLTGENPD